MSTQWAFWGSRARKWALMGGVTGITLHSIGSMLLLEEQHRVLEKTLQDVLNEYV
jgi:hypothetical protein